MCVVFFFFFLFLRQSFSESSQLSPTKSQLTAIAGAGACIPGFLIWHLNRCNRLLVRQLYPAPSCLLSQGTALDQESPVFLQSSEPKWCRVSWLQDDGVGGAWALKTQARCVSHEPTGWECGYLSDHQTLCSSPHSQSWFLEDMNWGSLLSKFQYFHSGW